MRAATASQALENKVVKKTPRFDGEKKGAKMEGVSLNVAESKRDKN
jgi:hypothetical protein